MSHLRPALVLLAAVHGPDRARLSVGSDRHRTGRFPGAGQRQPGRAGGRIVGSDLIGQAFTSDRYLWPRPSATSAPDPADPSKTVDAPYNAAASTGSNLGPTSAKLADRLAAASEAWREAGLARPIPGDAITTSGSGLDPHISPAYALAQVAADRRGPRPAEAQIRQVIEASTEGRTLRRLRRAPGQCAAGQPGARPAALLTGRVDVS